LQARRFRSVVVRAVDDRLAGRLSPAAEFPLIGLRGDRRPTRAAKGVYCVSADVLRLVVAARWLT
jgi:hypothetical protein